MILVTGGTGLIGSHLLYELVTQNKPVRAIRRPASNLEQVKKVFGYYSPSPEKIFDAIEWVDGDMLDPDSLADAMENVKQVYHTAAHVSFDPKDRFDILYNNIEGTANIVNVGIDKSIEKMCYVSSTAALGSPNEEGWVTEACIWKSAKHRSAYSISKFKSEMEIWRGISEGLNAVIVNPSIVIGPGNWNRSSSRLFKVIFDGMRYYTNGVTGYIYVKDVVKAMTLLMESIISGERFILSENNYSYRKIFDMIADALGKSRPSLHAGPLLTRLAWWGESVNTAITGRTPRITRETIKSGRNEVFFSSEKIKTELSFNFTSMEEAIGKTAGIFLRENK